MKIASWNVNKSNKLTEAKLRHFRHYNVICLQEVTAENLSVVRRIFEDFYVYVARENHLRKGRLKEELYLVTITDEVAQYRYSCPHEEISNPLQYRMMRRDIYIEFMFIDIEKSGIIHRIFNCHLQCVASPSVRKRQLEVILKSRDSQMLCIICGDLNTYSNPLIAGAAGWLLGYKMRDYFVFEERDIKDMIQGNGLFNPFESRKNTTLLKLGQLDYILVPKDADVGRAEVRKRFGSDHHPICLMINSIKSMERLTAKASFAWNKGAA